jgi:hypothetical protein
MSCNYMTSALVVGIERTNILGMVQGVKRIIVLVCDLGQHSCNMARAHKIKILHINANMGCNWADLVTLGNLV